MRKSLEVISLVILACMAWMTWSALAGPGSLPGRIPTHFNAAGSPDGWGAPAMLLLLPVIGIVLYAIITLVARIPSAFNYPVRVRSSARLRVESITLDMIAWIKVEILSLFAFLQSTMIRAAHGGDARLNPLLVPALIVVIFGTVVWHMAAVIRAARSATSV